MAVLVSAPRAVMCLSALAHRSAPMLAGNSRSSERPTVRFSPTQPFPSPHGGSGERQRERGREGERERGKRKRGKSEREGWREGKGKITCSIAPH